MVRFLFLAKFSAVLVCVAGVATGFGQTFNDLPSPASYGAKLEIRADLAFGESEQQKMDLFRPAGATRVPVVICWFGGAFWGSDRVWMENVAAFFAARGFAAVNPGYFLGAKDGSVAAWPRAVYDAKAAVRYLRAHAAELKIDSDRIVALGYSSGAYLAMMVGLTPNLTALEGPGEAPDGSSRVTAVIAISGVYDRRGDLGFTLPLLGRGYEEKYDLRVAASPILYVGPKAVPIYLLHGDHDSVAHVGSARQMAEALEGAHASHVLRLVDTDHFPITAGELQRIADWLAAMR